MSVVEHNILTKVLVAVGGSESSFSALNYGLDLASAANSIPTALIVEEILVTPELVFARGEELSRLVEQLSTSVRRKADETERRVREHASRRGMEIDTDRQTGRVDDCVVAAASDTSLLVLGRQGHYVQRSGLLGSNTESVVRRTRKPLLIAPQEYRRVKRILVAYGGKDFGGLALDTGRQIAEVLQCPLEVLTVADKVPVAEAIQQQAHPWLVGFQRCTTFHIEVGDPATAITEQCAADTLLVMGAYGHSRLYHMVLGSVTERVMRFAHGPVLLTAKQTAAASE